MTDTNTNIMKRVFQRPDSYGVMKLVTASWDKTNPLESFQIEADGFKGDACLETLKGIEDALGESIVEMKIESFHGEEPREVYLVGGDV